MSAQDDRTQLVWKPRRIAVATFDGTTLLTHGGRVRSFAVYVVDAAGRALPDSRIDLADDEVLHLCGDGRPHPIDSVSAVIAGSSGEGFLRHMRRRDIEAVTTAETDVATALADYLAGRVKRVEPPAHPHEHHDPKG